MIIPFSLLSTHSLRDTLWWRSYYSRYADCNFCLNVIKMLSYERMQHGLKIHIYIFICAHTKKYSQLSKDKDTYYTSLTEWHSKRTLWLYRRRDDIVFHSVMSALQTDSESAPLLLLHYIHHHWQMMANDTLFFSIYVSVLCFSSVGLSLSHKLHLSWLLSLSRPQRDLYLKPAMKSLINFT